MNGSIRLGISLETCDLAAFTCSIFTGLMIKPIRKHPTLSTFASPISSGPDGGKNGAGYVVPDAEYGAWNGDCGVEV